MTDLSTTLLEQLPGVSDLGMVIVAPDHRIVLWNRWMVDATGISPKAALGRPLTDLFPEIAGTRLAKAVENAIERGLASLLTPTLNKTLFPLTGKDGQSPITQMIAAKPLSGADGGTYCFVQVTDITEAARREALLRRQAHRMKELADSHRQNEMRMRAIVDSALDAIIAFDGEGRIATFNPAAERIFGYPAGNIVGKEIGTILPVCGDNSSPGDEDGDLWSRMAARQTVRECTGRRIDGEDIALELSLGTMMMEGRALYVVTARDITLRKQAEARVQYLAHYDSLTDLPNRVLFQERLNQALLQTRRLGNMFALMMLDLDRFKQVNDTLGHHVGDLLLKEVATRIRAAVRESDTVARLGGDEFAVILTNLANPQAAATIAETIIYEISLPFRLEVHDVTTSVSIGVAVAADTEDNPEDLLKHADLALYRAKARGRNTHEFYIPQMDAVAQAHKEMERELRRALRREELALDYQPLVDARTGEISGIEALVRWNHGERGHLDANDFIPMVRDTDLMVPIGNWVLRHACAQARSWQEAGLPPAPISVNLSALELCHDRFTAELREALERTGLNPAMLQLEFTEESLLLVADRAPKRIDELKEMGVRLSIDDFGSGASSLDYLRSHPVHQLKIDPGFLGKAENTEKGTALLASMVELGHNVGATIDVEGIETQAQMELARRLGAEDMQGFFLCRPMAPDSVERVLRAGTVTPKNEKPV